MISYYIYFNFFYFNKKNIFEIIINVWKKNKKNIIKNLLVFSVILSSTKLDIKNSVEYFLEIKVVKINTLILKKRVDKKKAFIYFNDFI
ncbi:MAG: hypothetical protein ACSHUF_00710 [Candidatus Nasuia deltocephalinicola]